MNTLNKIGIASLISIATSLAALAEGACENFDITLESTIPDNLLVRKIELDNGAKLEPSNFEVIKGNTQQKFTVNNASADDAMNGKIVLNTVSLPTKEVRLLFSIKNKKIFCEHTDNGSTGDYHLEKSRHTNGVSYKIG